MPHLEVSEPNYEPAITGIAAVEHARIKGEYYRDMSLNYPEYTAGRSWPDHPFPNESYANMGAFGAL